MARRGFTLLEILIVVSVLAVLIGIVVASLPKTKGSGNDVALKSNLATVQVQGVLYFSIGNTYGATNTGAGASCSATGTLFNDTTTTVEEGLKSAIAAATKVAQANAVVCRSTASAFLVAGQLTNGKYWCVDSVGSAKEVTGQPANTVTVCP